MTAIADQHEAAIGTIPFIDMSERIAVIAIINPAKCSECVILEFVNEFSHYFALQFPFEVTSYQIGLH